MSASAQDVVPTTPVRIAGELFAGRERVDVISPYDGAVVGRVPLCGEAEVDRACRAAAAVLKRDDFPQHRRAEVLERARGLLRERAEDLARIISRESAKPITTARGEVARTLDTLAFSAVECRKLSGEMVPAPASEGGVGKLAFALRKPIGVVAAIAPFNFPLNLVAHKIAPAIAAGCPVVLKPAPQTPLSGIALVELLIEAGLPRDFISVVTDRGREAGAPLVAHPIPKMITFTGSAQVGWMIAGQASKKRVALELGSSAPVIVEPGADLDRVAARVRATGFAHAGQSCISVQRVLVHESIHGALVARLEAAVASLVVGDPADERTEVGPMIRPAENARVAEWVAEAVAGGGVALCGARAERGVYLPTLVDRVPQGCRLWRQEVFGPVVTIRSYGGFDEAIALANDTDLRLQAGVFTPDLARALQAVRQLEFGGVIVNDVPTVRLDQQPYGGLADGGNTREGPAYAVAEMTELCFVSVQP